MFPYNWTLENSLFTKDRGKVFSCFACGGGSTMGYKLAGFDVIGCNEIDPKMIECYKLNHHPRFAFLEPIQRFKHRVRESEIPALIEKIGQENFDAVGGLDYYLMPDELYNLDILDGSPPCSSFSMSGNRGDDWGKEKKFREGQQNQVLDTLFFDFIDLGQKLQPKIIVAENVSGLMKGDAREYVKRIYVAFLEAGYQLRIAPYLLDASKMGVPQKRQRVFFIALRNDLADPFIEQVDMFQVAPKLDLTFNEKEIIYGEFRNPVGSSKGITPYIIERMNQKIKSDKSVGDINMRLYNKLSMFNNLIIHDEEVFPTLVSSSIMYRYFDNMTIPNDDILKVGSFPSDYNFNKQRPQYIVGMSVPPLMTARIATEIDKQWLSKINS